MNPFAISKLTALTAVVAFLITGMPLNSQETTVVIAKNSPQQILAELKASNADLLQKQEKTMQKLDELKQLADQLRIMAKRS